MIRNQMYFGIFLIIHVFAQAQSSPSNSVGVSAGAVYLSDDHTIDPGFQIEYARHLNLGHTPIHVGGSVEIILGEEQHIGLALSLGFSPLDKWEIGIGPGIMFEGDEHFYCVHVATFYAFQWGKYALGPVWELAHTGKHYHILLGIQFEFDF